MRKRHYLAHVFLIFLISIILFPVFWVVSTSFRRDQAAFSPRIVSSRLTLQHYRDLIFPEENLPAVILELQNVVSLSKPFDEMPQDKVLKHLEELLSRLKGFFTDSKKLFSQSLEAYDSIMKTYEESEDRLKEETIDKLEKIKSRLLEISNQRPSELHKERLAIYTFLEGERFNLRSASFLYLLKLLSRVDENFKHTYDAYSQGTISDNELKLAYEKALAKLADEYAEFIGISFEDLNKMKSEISTLESDLSSLSQNRDDLSRQILLYEEIARVTYQPALVNLNGIFKNASSLLDGAGKSEKLSGIFIEEESAFKILNNALKLSREIESILPNVDSFKNLHDEIGQLSKNLDALLQKWKSLDDSLKRTSVFADFVKIVENSETLLLSTLNEMKNFAENVLQTVTELTEVQKDYTEKIRKLTALKSKYESAQNLFKEKDSSLIPYRMKMASLITLNEVEYRQQNVQELESLSGKNLSRYELQLRKAREAINGFISAFQLSENDKRFLKDSTNEFVWISNFKTFVDRFESLKSRLPKLFEEMGALIKDFESNYRELLYTRFNGVFVSSSTLDRLYDLVKLDYANQVSGHLGTVVRYAGDLIYDFPLKSATRNAFKKIEGWLYKLGELWKQKPKHHFLRWVLNSVIVAGTVSIITTAVCAVAAYPFSRMRFPGRKYGILSLLIIQMFPGVMYMVALYGLLNLLGKFLPWLGLDSLGGLIFVYLGNIAFNMYLIKGFYDTIPDSMEEAAMIDGATRFQTFYKIVIPLASPILAVVVILTFMGTFNEFVLARIILQDTSNYTYAVGLWTFAVGPYETEWGIFTAAALVGMVPMLVLFLSLQRFLISGLTRGAVKG